jgi:hypothetical protein
MTADGPQMDPSAEQPLQIEMATRRLAAPAFDVQARA